MPNNVIFHNNGGFATSFSIQWDGGESGRTEMTTNGDTISMDLTVLTIPDGTSCWARAYIQGGPNHDSGDNFTYAAADTSTAVYTISGTTLNPSFSLSLNPLAVYVMKKGQSRTTAVRTSDAPVPTAASAPRAQFTSDDDSGRYVVFFNNGAFDANFSVQFAGGIGESYRTSVISAGQQTSAIDLATYTAAALPPGTSCWARVYVQGGVNHDSGRNFIYDPTSGATVQYTVTGGSLTPSFD
jgi:hypothetical protein